MTTLPDFLTEETEEVILARMLARVPPDVDKSEGSYIYDSCSAAAGEIAQLKIDMNEYLKRGFASTTFDEYLDARCDEHGVLLKEAEKATGTALKGNPLTITGVPGAIILEGTTVCTTADEATNTPSIEFVTLTEVTIALEGNVDVDIEAAEAGPNGNVPAGAINLLAVPITGVTAVTNAAPITGGLEAESDADQLDRYYEKVRDPGTSGNNAHYRQWAKEVPGVGDVKPIPLWNGLGTVKLVLLGIDKLPADAEVVQDVQDYIDPNQNGDGEGVAPSGATVTAVAATGVDIDTSATMILDGTKPLAEVETEYGNLLGAYLADIAFSDDTTVRYNHASNLLLDIAGVIDFTDFIINGGTANIAIAPDEVAVPGTVTLSE